MNFTVILALAMLGCILDVALIIVSSSAPFNSLSPHFGFSTNSNSSAVIDFLNDFPALESLAAYSVLGSYKDSLQLCNDHLADHNGNESKNLKSIIKRLFLHIQAGNLIINKFIIE